MRGRSTRKSALLFKSCPHAMTCNPSSVTPSDQICAIVSAGMASPNRKKEPICRVTNFKLYTHASQQPHLGWTHLHEGTRAEVTKELVQENHVVERMGAPVLVAIVHARSWSC